MKNYKFDLPYLWIKKNKDFYNNATNYICYMLLYMSNKNKIRLQPLFLTKKELLYKEYLLPR